MTDGYGTGERRDINIFSHECPTCGAKPGQEHVWTAHGRHGNDRTVVGGYKDIRPEQTDEADTKWPNAQRRREINMLDRYERFYRYWDVTRGYSVNGYEWVGHLGQPFDALLGDPPTKPQREGDQPPPIPNGTRDIQTLVIEDMEARRTLGIARYGTALQANNGRDALIDAYEEALDLVMYLKQAIVERGDTNV